jgi:hypothetical protein
MDIEAPRPMMPQISSVAASSMRVKPPGGIAAINFA